MVEFMKTERPIHISKIEALEELTGLHFPVKYKNHLLKYNGGRCYPNIFKFNENGRYTNSSIDWFLAIYEGEYDNLKKEIEMVKIEKKRMPQHILPIAHDPGGNLICISCGEHDYGYIYFWDHEKEVNYEFADDTDYSNLFFIEKDFDLFIESLTDELVV